jgi:hypothetical protein
VAQHPGDHGAVDPDQEAVDRIGALSMNPAPDEQPHRDRHQRQGEQARRRHRKRLGPGQRVKEPPFLSFQREYRDE